MMANHYDRKKHYGKYPMNLAERLWDVRSSSGYTSLWRLSQDTKIALSSLRKAEGGEINALKPITLCKLAKHLGVNVEWLIVGEGPKYRTQEQV